MSDEVEVDFDVVVVGAGPAGAVTAYLLAQAGHSVVMIERGTQPGAKNLSGGVLYTHSLREVFPDFLEEAPVERRITRNYVQFLNETSSFAMDYRDQRLADPVNAVTVLRAPFDAWLAGKAEEAGAFLMPGIRVDELLTDATGKVVGVKAGDDELRAHVVVCADGVNSFVARGLGLREKAPHNHMAVGVKQVVAMPREEIEKRFNVTGDEGAAWAVVGDCTQGVGGGGFMYTNTESISVGIVARLDDLEKSGKSITDLFDHYISHPYIAPYLDGGKVIEYGCHLVAEGGLEMVGEIATDGLVVVGDAAGLTLNTGLTVRGMDLAIGSGIAAAHGIDAALKAGDTSKAGLAGYRRELFESFVGKDMETYAKAPAFLERERMYKVYGPFIADIFHGVFAHDLKPRRHLIKVAKDTFKSSGIRLRDVISDALAGVKAL